MKLTRVGLLATFMIGLAAMAGALLPPLYSSGHRHAGGGFNTSSIILQTNSNPQMVPIAGYAIITVAVPSTVYQNGFSVTAPTVSVWQDSTGACPLGTVAAGVTTSYFVSGPVFVSSASPSQATCTGTLDTRYMQANATTLTFTTTDITPTASQYASSLLILAGSPAAVHNLILPLTTIGQQWMIENNTGQIITVEGATGNGFAVPVGSNAVVWSDGTNFTGLTRSASYVLTTAGTAVTGTASETQAAVATIPANAIGIGTTLKVHYQGTITGHNGSDTLTVNVRFGTTTLTGTLVVTGNAINASSGWIFSGEVTFVGRAAAGATAAMVANGWFVDPAAAGGGTFRQTYIASTNFATNGALLCEVTLTWSSSSGTNSARVDVMNLSTN